MSVRRDLPSIPPEAGKMRPFLEAMREAVQTYLGYRGDALDRGLTVRDVVPGPDGTVVIDVGTGGSTGGGGTIVINPPGAGEAPDLTPPPTPVGLVVTAGLTEIYVSWDVAAYTVGHGPGQTNVYGKPWPEDDLSAPTFSEAILVGVAPHALTSYALSTEPATRWCIWLKFQSADGVESATPAGGANGEQATTGQDVTKLLEALSGEITHSQLYSALGARIDLIDGPLTLPGSVAARVQTVQTLAEQAGADASAAAALVTTVQSQVAGDIGMKTARYWGFDSAPDGWSATGAGLSPVGGVLIWQPSAANATFGKTFVTAERFDGARNTRVRARVRRTAGTGAWEGALYYQTAGHTISSGFVKNIPAPADLAAWNVLEWDMTALTAGGTDWVSNEIRGLRIDLVSDATSTWEIDWVAVGEPSTTPLSASVQQEITTRAAETGYLGAQYSLRVDVGGKVGGFGISGTTAPGAQPTINFIIRADKFAIAPPSGSGEGNVVPFAVTTTTTTLNGVSVPAGTYINNAFIRNGTITDAMIGNATISSAKIASLNAIHLTAGTGVIGGNLRSTNYVSGTGGWILRPDGTLELNTAIVRGSIFAADGTIGGIQINATDIRSTNYASESAGFMLTSSGSLFANNVNLRGEINGGAFTGFAWPASGTGYHLSASGLLLGRLASGRYFRVDADGDVTAPGLSISAGNAVFSGDLSAAGGTFSGNLSAAGGTFAGTLTATTVAVQTANIAGQAVTVTAAAELGSSDSVSIGSSFTTICSTTLNSGGNPIAVIATVAGSFGLASEVITRVLIAGTEERSVILADAPLRATLVALKSAPGTGTITVSLQARINGASGSTTAGGGTALFALGCKR